MLYCWMWNCNISVIIFLVESQLRIEHLSLSLSLSLFFECVSLLRNKEIKITIPIIVPDPISALLYFNKL